MDGRGSKKRRWLKKGTRNGYRSWFRGIVMKIIAKLDREATTNFFRRNGARGDSGGRWDRRKLREITWQLFWNNNEGTFRIESKQTFQENRTYSGLGRYCLKKLVECCYFDKIIKNVCDFWSLITSVKLKPK